MSDSVVEITGDFTDASIEKVGKVNSLQKVLIENSQRLTELGVQKVLFFGSAKEGVARPDSDIDICIIHQPIILQTNDYRDPEWMESMENFDVFEKNLLEILGDVSLDPPPKGEGQNVIHVSLVPRDSPFVDESGIPEWDSGSVVI